MTSMRSGDRGPLASIDEDHRVQMRMARRVAEALRSGAGPDAMRERLDDLISYTDAHFSFEELLMRLSAYPEFAVHAGDHARMMETLYAVVGRCAEGGWRPSSAELDGLVERLARHIANRDETFGAYYQDWLKADIPAAPPRPA